MAKRLTRAQQVTRRIAGELREQREQHERDLKRYFEKVIVFDQAKIDKLIEDECKRQIGQVQRRREQRRGYRQMADVIRAENPGLTNKSEIAREIEFTLAQDGIKVKWGTIRRLL